MKSIWIDYTLAASMVYIVLHKWKNEICYQFYSLHSNKTQNIFSTIGQII
jgi:hypothetical protein